jgi:phosphoribosylformylglycinamidine synthase
MASVTEMAFDGTPVLGICNGFQILCEAGLLPGALIANRGLKFICRTVELEVVDTNSILTRSCRVGDRLQIPLNSYEGNYVDPKGTGRVVVRYVDNPNGSQNDAAAIANAEGNVVGIMPHPERASESILGSTDGLRLLEGFVASMEVARV